MKLVETVYKATRWYEINQQTENEKLREWVWDYIESMGGEIDREKIRREQPLEDYEYYGDEDDHK